MSLSSEITRLQNAKSALKTSIEAKGVTVSDSTLISGYAALVDQIPTGGGGGNEDLINLIERDITSITIPYGTTKIGDYAFHYCTGLTSVNIPNSVTSIGYGAFNYCSGLTSVEIPNSVTSIGSSAFQSCGGLTSVTIPNSVTSIGKNAFRLCRRLTSVTIHATTPPTLDNYAFNDTNNCPIYVPAESVDAYMSATNWSSYTDRIQAIVA